METREMTKGRCFLNAERLTANMAHVLLIINFARQVLFSQIITLNATCYSETFSSYSVMNKQITNDIPESIF